MKDLSKAYRESGVDILKASTFIDRIKGIVKGTHTKGVLSDIGLFGGMFKLDISDIKSPVLVAATDGVGTKLKLAFDMNKHDTVGIDLVAMNVNDIVVHGAKPLFFLDYLAMGELDTSVAEDIIKGISEGCKQSGCALLGGETAELPGFYKKGEYELSGFSVGVVDDSKIIDGSTIGVGNVIIGLASSGVHSNGFSLIRKIIRDKSISLEEKLNESTKTLGEILLTPTKIYVGSILNLIRDFHINGMAHITGGGFFENIPRILPRGVKAKIDFYSFEKPLIFQWIKEQGNLSWEEMMSIFNCGIGIVLIVKKKDVDDILNRLNGLNEKAWIIGEIQRQEEESDNIEIYF
ncbi:phosphoribosylformylglycinamidine cyclo-ligase [Desulfothermus okinawensis JCM 13304]